MLPRRPWFVWLLLALACSKSKEARVCTALEAAGPLETRMADVFPVQFGGMILVFDGAEAPAIARVFGRLGLEATQVVACGPRVATWVPAVDESSAAALEQEVLSSVPAAKTRERVRIPPQRAKR